MGGGEFGFGDHVAVGGAGRHHRVDVSLLVDRDVDHAGAGCGESRGEPAQGIAVGIQPDAADTERLRKGGAPLREYVQQRFYRGITTGLNEAFVVNRSARDRMIAEHPSSKEVLKPFLRGRDVKRWRVDY